VTSIVRDLWRFPVKSMQGERVDEVDVTTSGIVGDRVYAVVDGESNKVGSAKHPRLWGALLQARARTDGDDVVITFPDGTERGVDDADIDDRLSALLGRPARLTATAPERARYLAVWPKMDGVMPDVDRAAIGIGDDPDGTLSDLALAMAAPKGTFFDVAALHLVATSTLDALGFPVERWRPSVVVDTPGSAPFPENDWPGGTLDLGGVTASVFMPTMRCIMTTLAQGDLPRDNEVLRTVTKRNRIDVPNMGVYSCVGAYASVTVPGRIAVGDPAVLP
jgi:uncharacterized protein YcbX